ncbi:hypothetical protein ACIBEJ_48635 [Nonomuraea sp. NPDC050790]|uniref:hypothetical protein n=1 Tax=Nonomuraea sp. NPDC050790 TaxID=3364371 RepID=UPI0037AB0560
MRLGRSQPFPPILAPIHRSISQQVELAPFDADVDFPPLSVVTPDARVLLGPFDADVDFPPLTLSYGHSITLAPFDADVDFPPLSVVTPIQPGDAITAAGQVEWNGTVWGPGTALVVQQIDGWHSLPGIDNLNVERPSRHGAWSGRKIGQQRLVTIRMRLSSGPDPHAVDDLLDQLLSATGIGEDDTELPLVIKGYGDPRLAYGAVIDRDIPMNSDWSIGRPTISLLIACSDPRRYNVLRSGAALTAGVPTPVVNAGNTGTHPIVRFDGPVSNPKLTNATLARDMEFLIELEAGQRLEVNTDLGTASVGATNVMGALTGSSVAPPDFVLGRGTNALTYTVGSGGAIPCSVLYRDAWL